MTATPAYSVVVATPAWKVNGVNAYATHLVRGLLHAGVRAHILVSHPPPQTKDTLPLPADLPFESLGVGPCFTWQARWRGMADYLRAKAPCIYIPNNDYRHACIAPLLPPEVAVVGMLHSDSPEHYGDLDRMGPYWNAAVAVSDAIRAEAAARHPEMADRLHTIRCGLDVPSAPPVRASDAAKLRLVYAGRIDQHQKRVLDLPVLMDRLAARGVPVQLDIFGAGRDEAALRDAMAKHLDSGTARMHGAVAADAVLTALEEAEVFVLPSAFEGLPIALLEAMSRGCVPVVTAQRSGIPEVVWHGQNGFLAPVGDMAGFADHIAALHADRALLKRMATSAHTTVAQEGFSTADMARNFIQLFDEIWQDLATGAYQRPAGPVLPPPGLKPLWRCAMPAWMQCRGR